MWVARKKEKIQEITVRNYNFSVFYLHHYIRIVDFFEISNFYEIGKFRYPIVRTSIFSIQLIS